jgi:hypothetical protein
MLKEDGQAQNCTQRKKCEENLFDSICDKQPIMDEMAMTSTKSTVLNYDENIYFITNLQNPRNGRRQKTIYFHYRDKGKIKVFLLYETLEILNFKSLRKKKDIQIR